MCVGTGVRASQAIMSVGVIRVLTDGRAVLTSMMVMTVIRVIWVMTFSLATTLSGGTKVVIAYWQCAHC